MNYKGVVIFGPWCGEVSYELSWWNPEIRKIRNEQYKDYYAVHIGFQGRRAMYKDFIDEYIPFPKEVENVLNCTKQKRGARAFVYAHTSDPGSTDRTHGGRASPMGTHRATRSDAKGGMARRLRKGRLDVCGRGKTGRVGNPGSVF